MNTKTILIPLFTLFISINISAQRINKEKIKALKIAHITEQLDLTEKEAQAFWPIYNANEEARRKLRENNSVRKLKKENIDAFTEDEAQTHLDAISKMEYARIELQKQYENKLRNVLSAKKTLKLLRADRSFRDKMIRVFKERHRDSRPKKRNN